MTDTLVTRLKVLAWQIFLPAVFFVAISQLVFNSTPVVTWIAKYRPSAGQSRLELNVSRQVLAMDATARTLTGKPAIAIAGSSAVVNGVDVDRINAIWESQGFPYQAVNFGQTGLLAYELAILDEHYLHTGVAGVVYLYNSFSLANQLLGSVVGARWKTADMLHLVGMRLQEPADWRRFSTGFMSEHLALLRHGNVLKSIALRAATGTLTPLPHFHDFSPEPGLDALRPRVAATPAPDSDWLRAAYVESERVADGLGRRGLELFLERARTRGIKVVIGPAPEPEFSRFNKWRVGTNPEILDARMAEIAKSFGTTSWPRAINTHFETNDHLFRDQTHFNRFGREEYSVFLAERIAAEFR